MGRRRSAGTGTPATRYLYMSACCSSSSYCAAVKGGGLATAAAHLAPIMCCCASSPTLQPHDATTHISPPPRQQERRESEGESEGLRGERGGAAEGEDEGGPVVGCRRQGGKGHRHICCRYLSLPHTHTHSLCAPLSLSLLSAACLRPLSFNVLCFCLLLGWSVSLSLCPASLVVAPWAVCKLMRARLQAGSA